MLAQNMILLCGLGIVQKSHAKYYQAELLRSLPLYLITTGYRRKTWRLDCCLELGARVAGVACLSMRSTLYESPYLHVPRPAGT